ncbi:MAG: NAD(P)/FAD-dependent oxidoreductase, partial [Eggerthellaceae bacterium]|nr:NAD(P)/FAD-dependent oxidoreductase [Eggerthellaceae bacterium]
MKRIAVIGGGAAGLSCAIVSGQAGASVRIFEMDERVGRRILATGNGRCNFSNAGIRPEVYRNAGFVAKAFERVTPVDVREFFADLGLLWETEPDGRMLPRTGKASTVVDVLRARCAALGVEECCNAKVRELVPPSEVGGPWTLVLADGRFERAEAVVVTTGGQDAFGFLPEGVAATPFSPVLGPPKTDTSQTKGLDGIRVRAQVSLACHERPDIAEDGELLFRKYGVSGICVFNLSRHIDDDYWENFNKRK